MLSSENELSSYDITPEHTLVESMEAKNYQQQLLREHHRKLSQQNSIDRPTEGNNITAGTSGRHTIADLQQKLYQLTSQPSESAGTPPMSHPATPHSHQTTGIQDVSQQKFGTNGNLPGTCVQPLVRINIQ